METRWNLFNQLLMLALSKHSISWLTAVQVYKDVQDPNIKYNIDGTSDSDSGRELGGMVIEYVNWKAGNGGKPDWFIKSS